MVLAGSIVDLRVAYDVTGSMDKMQRKFRKVTQGNFCCLIQFREGDIIKSLHGSINIHLNISASFSRTAISLYPGSVSGRGLYLMERDMPRIKYSWTRCAEKALIPQIES